LLKVLKYLIYSQKTGFTKSLMVGLMAGTRKREGRRRSLPVKGEIDDPPKQQW